MGQIKQGLARSLGNLNKGVPWLDPSVAWRVGGRAGGSRTR